MKKKIVNVNALRSASTFVLTCLIMLVCGVTSSAQKMTTVSSAQLLDAAKNEYRLTPDLAQQMGAIWSESYLDLSKSFEIQAELYFGTKDATGADGIAFVLQPNCTGEGSKGVGLGYQGITPSIAIEFDTWQNTEQGDPADDHICIQKNGDPNHNLSNNLSGDKMFKGSNFEDGKYHTLKIVWDVQKKLLSYYFDSGRGSTSSNSSQSFNDIKNEIFNGNNLVFWGFTASTGGSSNEQKVKITSAPKDEINPIAIKEISAPGMKDGEIAVEMMGGNAPFSYSFDKGVTFSSNPVKGGLAAGTYTVVAKDSKGCTSKFEVEIPENTPISVDCRTEFFFSETPTPVAGNKKQVSGKINGIGYTYTSTMDVELADFSKTGDALDKGLINTKKSMLNDLYPNALNTRDGSNVFNGVEANKLGSSVQIKNQHAGKNIITFDEKIKNPVLYFTSIGKKGLKVPIKFETGVNLLGKHGYVEISSDKKTITGEEGLAIVEIPGEYKTISFDYSVAENYCFFSFGAAFTNCETLVNVTEVNCESDFYFSDNPVLNPTNSKQATGTIQGIAYTYESDQAITIAKNGLKAYHEPSYNSMASLYPLLEPMGGGDPIFSDKETQTLLNANQIVNKQVTKNTITFTKPIKNPVLYFYSIGQNGQTVPIKFDQDIKVLGTKNGDEYTVTTRSLEAAEGIAVVQIPGEHSVISFTYTVAENACFFFFGAEVTTCDADCDNPSYIDDVIKYKGEILKPNQEIRIFQGERMVSANERYQLRITKDGNLVIEEILSVLICNGKTLVTKTSKVWQAPTPIYKNWDPGKNYWKFGSDNNICFLSNQNNTGWCAHQQNPEILNSCKKLVLTDDGRLVLIGNGGNEVWSSTPRK